MQIDRLIQAGHKHLVLFFNGWSTPPALFRHLELPAHSDCWLVYDYRQLFLSHLPVELANYDSIQVYAWSLGVWVASQVLPKWGNLPITKAIAINGTPTPLSRTEGIPEAAFRATLRHLTPEGLHLFNQRICQTAEALRTYEACAPRPLPEVAEELRALYAAIKGAEAETGSPWDLAYVSSPEVGDAIFPVANQLRAWQSRRVPVSFLQAPHCPFLHDRCLCLR